MVRPANEVFHSRHVFADIVAPNVMGTLLPECEALPADLGNEALAEIFQLQSKGSLPEKEDVDRAAQVSAERIFQSDLLVRLSHAQFHGQFVLEIGFRTEDRTPSGHIGHHSINFDQFKLPAQVARGGYSGRSLTERSTLKTHHRNR